MEGEPLQPTTDERVIAAGIWEARAEDREVADDIARKIAAQLHGGQATALYSFASTGAIQDYERLRDELVADYERQPEQVREWIDCLGTYALHTGERGPVEGWAGL
jgi:hypothetical protein